MWYGKWPILDNMTVKYLDAAATLGVMCVQNIWGGGGGGLKEYIGGLS